MERQQSHSSNVVRTSIDGLSWLDMCHALETAKEWLWTSIDFAAISHSRYGWMKRRLVTPRYMHQLVTRSISAEPINCILEFLVAV